MTEKKKNKKPNSKNKEKSNILFETSTIIDKNEFKKFQKFYLNKFKSSLLPKLVMAFLAIIAIVMNLIKSNFDIVIMVIVFIIIYPIILSITLNRQINKMYESNKRINMLEEKLMFYDKYFESKSSLNYCKVNYSDIYKICETKSNFYIFISDNQAFIIIKSNIKDVDSFKDFIKDKAMYRRYR